MSDLKFSPSAAGLVNVEAVSPKGKQFFAGLFGQAAVGAEMLLIRAMCLSADAEAKGLACEVQGGVFAS